MTEIQRYLAEEIAEDHAVGLVSRREPYAGWADGPIAGLFVKPSDRLEPSTPSLPFRFRGGTRGYKRVAEGTKTA